MKPTEIINSLLSLTIDRITKKHRKDVVTWTFHLQSGQKVTMTTEALTNQQNSAMLFWNR